MREVTGLSRGGLLNLNLLFCRENPQGKLDHADELDAAGNFLMASTRSPGMSLFPGALFSYCNDRKERLGCMLIDAPQASDIEEHPTATWLALLKSVAKIDVAARVI